MPTPTLSGEPGLLGSVSDPKEALVWGSLSPLEKFSCATQQ